MQSITNVSSLAVVDRRSMETGQRAMPFRVNLMRLEATKALRLVFVVFLKNIKIHSRGGVCALFGPQGKWQFAFSSTPIISSVFNLLPRYGLSRPSYNFDKPVASAQRTGMLNRNLLPRAALNICSVVHLEHHFCMIFRPASEVELLFTCPNTTGKFSV